MTIRDLTSEDVGECQAIIEGLPAYFTDDVPDKVRRDIERHRAWAITWEGTIVGFAIVDQRSNAAAEVLWMAVREEFRGQGLGTQLLDTVLEILAADDVKIVEAKTLDASSHYEPYQATRGFWERRRFIHVDSIDPLPEWPPGNPAALYICALASTR